MLAILPGYAEVNRGLSRVGRFIGKPPTTTRRWCHLPSTQAHAPRTLTHTVLLQRIWGPEKFGEPWLLRNVVKKLRRKLGDAAADPKYIITEPRVGYRMATGSQRCD